MQLLRTFEAKQLPPELLARASGHTVEHLRQRQRRIAWDSFRTVMANASAVLGQDGLFELGAQIARRMVPLRLPRVARMLLGPADLYMVIARRKSIAKRWFSCIDMQTWEPGARDLVFEICLERGYAPCPELYSIAQGALTALPTLLDLPRASVTAERTSHGTLFHLQLPDHTGLVTRARHTARRLWTLRVAVDELRAAHDMLNRQYEELRRTQAVLAESEARFRALIENSSDCTVLTDAHDNISYLSPSAQRIVGYASSELVGSRQVDLAHPDDRSAMLAAIRELSEASGRMATLRYRFRHKNNSWIWLEGTAKNMLDDHRVQAVVINYRDVTDRVQLEEQLLQSRKLESIGRLAGGIAHDFNNMLTGVLNSAHLALSRLPPDHPERNTVEQIAEYVRRGADLTSQLLSFARKQEVKPQVVDLNGLVLQTRVLLDRLIGDQVQIVTSLQPALHSVEVDPNQFQQVLVNLALNARDAMPHGGTLTVSTANASGSRARGGQHDEHVLLDVSDNGSGMDEQTLEHIFEPFFTTKGAGQGTGLGLATCHGIVAQAGGQIEVTSRPGAGTTFRIYLPTVDACPIALPKPAALQPLQGSETLLLVDDEPAVRVSTSELVRSLGYSVLTAQNGIAALDLAQRYKGTLHGVITDVVMPKLSGPELVERLQRLHPGLKALYISGYAPASTLPEGALLLQKPFEMAELTTKLRELLQSPSSLDPLEPEEQAARHRNEL